MPAVNTVFDHVKEHRVGTLFRKRLVKLVIAFGAGMALNFNTGFRVLQNTGHRLVQNGHGFRFQFGAARLKIHTGQFHARVVENYRKAARACRGRNIRSRTAFKGTCHAFAVNGVGIFARNMERHFAFGIGRDRKLVFRVILAHKREFLVHLRHIFIVGVSHC